MARYDEQGRQIPDPIPVAIPAGFKHPESLADFMRRVIRNEMSNAAADQGAETFEEANDFEIPDEEPEMNQTSFEEMADEQSNGIGNPFADRGRREDLEQDSRLGAAGDDARPGGSGEHHDSDSGDGTRPGGKEDNRRRSVRPGGNRESDDEAEDRSARRTDKTRQRQTSSVVNPPKGHYNPALDGADSED